MLDARPTIVKFALFAALATTVVAFLHGLLSFYYFGGKFLGLTSKATLVENVAAKAGETVTADRLMDYLGVEIGAPLFSRKAGLFSSDLKTRYRQTAANSTLAALSVERHFNGKVVIEASERIPVARLPGSGLVVDREGVVFVCRKVGVDQLPQIEGPILQNLDPGNRLLVSMADTAPRSPFKAGKAVTSNMTVAALRMLDCLADGNTAISLSRVARINIDHTDYIHVYFKDGRSAKISWSYMTAISPLDGRAYLEAQLNGLALAFQNRAGRGFRNFDFTIKGRGYGVN
jgi:hypothetical protein